MIISIIICTYNPRKSYLELLFNSLLKMEKGTLEFEILLIDNCSTPPANSIINSTYFENVKYFQENQSGLTFARLRGLKESTGSWLIYFDDDNEPDSSYLKVFEKLKDINHVGVIGPGTINVGFDSEPEPWIRADFLPTFQDRHVTHFTWSNQREWTACYPYGSGFIVRREVMEEYAKRIRMGRYSAVDRNGKTLSSSGDAQIVFTAIDMGLSASIHPGLCLVHHIPGERTTADYLKRLAFGISSSYWKALVEVFDEKRKEIPGKSPSNTKWIMKTGNYFISNISKGWKTNQVHFSGELGKWASYSEIAGFRLPSVYFFITNKLMKL